MYTAPCYAHPVLSLNNCLPYPEEDLIIFVAGYDKQAKIDNTIKLLKDLLVFVELAALKLGIT